jgi:hypothetical protein
MIERAPTIVLALAVAASAAAQDPSPPAPSPAPSTDSIILAPTAAPPAPLPRTEAPRSAISAQITSVLPPFDPKESLPKLAPAPDESDKPRNKIPRLPANLMLPYIVHGVRPPVFRTRDLYTKQGLIELAYKEHPLMRIGNFFHLKDQVAYKVIIGEELARDRADLTEEALAFASVGDGSEVKVMQQAIIDESFEGYGDDMGGGPVGIK